MTYRCPNGQYYFERIPPSQNIEYHVNSLFCFVELQPYGSFCAWLSYFLFVKNMIILRWHYGSFWMIIKILDRKEKKRWHENFVMKFSWFFWCMNSLWTLNINLSGPIFPLNKYDRLVREFVGSWRDPTFVSQNLKKRYSIWCSPLQAEAPSMLLNLKLT